MCAQRGPLLGGHGSVGGFVRLRLGCGSLVLAPLAPNPLSFLANPPGRASPLSPNPSLGSPQDAGSEVYQPTVSVGLRFKASLFFTFAFLCQDLACRPFHCTDPALPLCVHRPSFLAGAFSRLVAAHGHDTYPQLPCMVHARQLIGS